jgi:hypothetical protein
MDRPSHKPPGQRRKMFLPCILVLSVLLLFLTSSVVGAVCNCMRCLGSDMNLCRETRWRHEKLIGVASSESIRAAQLCAAGNNSDSDSLSDRASNSFRGSFGDGDGDIGSDSAAIPAVIPAVAASVRARGLAAVLAAVIVAVAASVRATALVAVIAAVIIAPVTMTQATVPRRMRQFGRMILFIPHLNPTWKIFLKVCATR